MTTQHGVAVRGEHGVPHSPQFEGRFGRMFRRLPACPEYSLQDLTALAETMREPEAPTGWNGVPQQLDNPNIPAGYTYFGQFIDHDITFDPQSSLDQSNDPDALVDFRTPRFDLDSLYGSGPKDDPFMYRQDDPRKLLLTVKATGEFDLPRNADGVALIGDPRNDENIIVSQLHTTFARLHNKFVDQVAADPAVPADQVFARAQRLTRWHYQRVIVDDYLRRTCGDAVVDDIFEIDATSGRIDIDRKYYRPKTRAYMPVEFSAAAFRFGHSQVRGIYDLNQVVTQRPIFAPGDNVDPLADLRGGRPLPDQWQIDWTHFLPIDQNVSPQLSRLIDAKLVPALFDLPGSGAGGPALALLNLRRGQAMGLPSGQDVARHLHVPQVLTGAELGAPEPTPLWFYILKESELHGGQQLGAVGARVVAEVLIGLLDVDTQSWISQDQAWVPTVVATGPQGRLTLGDLVNFAIT